MSGYNGQTNDDDARADWANYYDLYYTKRGKIQLNITQPLAPFGSFFIIAAGVSHLLLLIETSTNMPSPWLGFLS